MNKNGTNDTSKKTLEDEYLSQIEDKIYKMCESENETDELQNIINNIDMIKLDNQMDFIETFKNQIYFLIKPDKYKNFFDFKTKKDSNILDFIINFALKLKPINQENETNNINEKKKDKDKKKEKKKDKKIKTNNANISKEDNNDKSNNNISMNDKNRSNSNSINSGSSSYSSSLYLSVDRSNLFDSLNKSLKNSKEIQEKNKTEEQNLKDDKESDIKINNENLNKSQISKKEEKKEKNYNENINEVTNKDENKSKNKEEDLLYLKKDFKFEDIVEKKLSEKTNKVKVIRSFEDTSEINGKSFEYDTINYIFQKIYTNSINKDFYITYDYSPDMNVINNIFKEHKLLELKGIQFDFIVNDLRISELINFLIDIHLGIYPNSKISFINSNKFFSRDDLIKLKNKEEFINERIDIIGEVGINIFNEDEKNEQLLKYSKLIYNINFLIKEQAEDLSYLLDLLHLNGNNKKLLLFITDGSYSYFNNIKNNKFQEIQKVLSVNSLLVFRNKNSLFRTKLLEKILKSFKKGENKLFNDNLSKSYNNIIKQSAISFLYEKVVKNLSLIEKKINYISNIVYASFIKKSLLNNYAKI